MTGKFRVSLNSAEFDLEEVNEGFKIDDEIFKPEIIFNGKFYKVFIKGHEFKIEFKDNAIFLDGKEIDFNFKSAPFLKTLKSDQNLKTAEIKAAIPGKIVELKVHLGEEVKDQQCILIIESMKMRNEILSPINGIVEQILVNINDQIAAKQLLMKIAPKKL